MQTKRGLGGKESNLSNVMYPLLSTIWTQDKGNILGTIFL